MLGLIYQVYYSLADITIVSVGDNTPSYTAYNYAGNRFVYIKSNQTFWVIFLMIVFFIWSWSPKLKINQICFFDGNVKFKVFIKKKPRFYDVWEAVMFRLY